MNFYRCPFCRFRATTLYAIKEHAKRKHAGITKCPVCGKQYTNVYLHFYLHADDDNNHLVLTYLFTRYKLREIAKVKELLSEG